MKYLIFLLSSDSAIAFSAAFIALLSLFVSYWQLEIQRTFNRNQLKPLPWFYISYGTNDQFFIDFYNDGLGPLVIVSTKFERAGKTKDNLHEVIDSSTENYKVLSPGKPIGAGVTIRLWQKEFKSTHQNTSQSMEKLLDNFLEIKATIIYKDVYNTVYPPFKRDFGFMKKSIENNS